MTQIRCHETLSSVVRIPRDYRVVGTVSELYPGLHAGLYPGLYAVVYTGLLFLLGLSVV